MSWLLIIFNGVRKIISELFFFCVLAGVGIHLQQLNWGRLSQTTDPHQSSNTEQEDFHRCHAFRGVMQHGTPATHWTSPQPDISPASMLVSVSIGLLCYWDPLFLSINVLQCQCVFYISHNRELFYIQPVEKQDILKKLCSAKKVFEDVCIKVIIHSKMKTLTLSDHK